MYLSFIQYKMSIFINKTQTNQFQKKKKKKKTQTKTNPS